MTVDSDHAASRPRQDRGAERPVGGDGDAAAGTNGWRRVTSGAPLWVLALTAVIIISICTVNVLSALHDVPHFRAPGHAWPLFTWEASSGATTLLLLPFVAALTRLGGAPTGGRRLRFAAVHLGGAVGFSVIHVTGFIVLRTAVYAAHGRHYDFGGVGEWLYEFRKDALSYVLQASFIGMATAWSHRAQDAASAPAASPDVAPLVAIVDGVRTLRVPPMEIVAATSAGNYVEFRLADGRRPLQRSTLAEVEAELAPHGFVRTHRSWLVNAARVREIVPTGSGDRRLTLDDGGEAPLSRRYEAALETLRG